MKHPETGWVEADIIINGEQLTYAESLTLRVALGLFAMWLTSASTREGLGLIAAGYQDAVASLNEKVHKNQP